MISAALPADETQRLETLRRYEVLDTAAEREFDDITLLASHICGTPIAVISLLDTDRQWFKSKVGTATRETPRDIAFCAHGILQAEVFVVKDARVDERFADNPLVTGEAQVRFYAGARLMAPNGQALGMLCVKDRVARDITPEQRTALEALSRQVVSQLELRRNIRELRETIAERERVEEKLGQTHKELMEASRRAGMAEIAGNVLHNVGNVLNSVNVASTVIADKVRGSKVANLGKVGELMRAHANDLGEYLTNDPKGKQLPGYLSQLAGHLATEQNQLLEEVGSLVNYVVHIKEIVAMQQNYAKASGVTELAKVKDLVEDAMRMNNGAITRHNVKVTREYTEMPAILTERHKVLQILVNLIRNAQHACSDSDRADKEIVLRVTNSDGRAKISVIDNGVGIPADIMPRLFTHGFTTRKDGNGFGLHSGALAANELGGKLTAFSDGKGQGATFTLELPLQ